MFRKLVSAIIEDNNTRLHRVPFALLWFVSYGLAWYVLYIYEMIWYDWNFDPLLSWLKFSSQGPWREALVVGALFGLMLSFIQTWLIRLRYGYVPKFWSIATILGATLAGFGYPRVGLRTGEYLLGLNWMGVNHPPRADSLINDFLIWFTVLGVFQAIVMFRVNRKAWLLIVVGVCAGTIASIPLLYPAPLYGKPIWTLIMGTAIQSFGTCLLFLHFMAHPREETVPEYDKLKNKQDSVTGPLAASPFILLWVGIYYLQSVLIIAVPELWAFLVYYSPNAIFYGLGLNNSRGSWYESVIFYVTEGFIIAIAQHWLMKKQSGRSMPGWQKFTVIGWVCAGLVWWMFRHVYPRTELEGALLFGGYVAIPALFQAFPMNRVFKGGWIWAVLGVFAGMLAVLFRGEGLNGVSTFYGVTFAGLALSLATAIVFLRLQSQHRVTSLALAEVDSS